MSVDFGGGVNQLSGNSSLGQSCVGDFKHGIQGSDHDGWLLWSNGRTLNRITYKNLWNLISQNASLFSSGVFGYGDGSTTFTLGDILGRFLGGAGSASGLTTRSAGAKVGAETTSQVASHTHSNSFSFSGNTGTDSHTHSMSHTHSINHNHGTVLSQYDSPQHAHKITNISAKEGWTFFLYDELDQGGYADYSGSGGAGPDKIFKSGGPITQTGDALSNHYHNVVIPNYTGNSGTGSVSSTGLNSHSHTLSITLTGNSDSTGVSNLSLMNPGIYFNLFIYAGV